MRTGGRRKSIAFIVLGATLVAGALALNVGWVIVNWRQAGLLLVGVLVFPLLITGVVLNTIFLIREIRRNEQHEAFINAMTHELKTPLASMKLYLQTLQTREVGDAKRQDFYRVMLEDGDRLLDTIEQVLRAGKLGARIRRPEQTPVDLPTIVRESVALTRRRYQLAPDAIVYRESLPSNRPWQVLGDEDDLRAAVTNLVDNAVKYSGQTVHVEVDLEHADEATATLHVRDRGVGISPGDRKRIFKRFYRVPSVVGSRVKGTGLGLFIVRSVIMRHGGTVSVASGGPGQGSTFTVRLPVLTAT